MEKLSEADTRVMVALFTRMSHGQNARPFVVGWVGEEIRLSIVFSANKPSEALLAAARLAATVGVEVLVYSCDAFTSPNLDVPPSQDPEAQECIMGFGWHKEATVGWSSLVNRDDQGTLSYSEPHRLEEPPMMMDRLIRQGLGKPDSLDALSGWLSEYQHSLHIYPQGT